MFQLTIFHKIYELPRKAKDIIIRTYIIMYEI